MRTPLAAGNWKMNLDGGGAEALARALATGAPADLAGRVEIALFPPFVHLERVARAVRGSAIRVGAQNMSWEAQGPFTGEISADMILQAGGSMVLLGHSERRHILMETDAMIQRKTARAHETGLDPVVCVGEKLDQREAGRALEVIEEQLARAMDGLNADRVAATILAYEPVWAIGTGRTATPDQAQEAHAFVRERVSKMAGSHPAESIRIVYGGSVTPENIDALVACPDVDGALVGGASLKAEKFLRIVNGAARKR